MTDAEVPLCLQIDHRVALPPPTSSNVLGTWTIPNGGQLVAVLGDDGTTVVCCWSQRPRKRWLRWYTRVVVPPLHAILAARWGVGAGRTAHAFVDGSAPEWSPVVAALNAARRRAQH